MKKYKKQKEKNSNFKIVIITAVITILIISFIILTYCIYISYRASKKYETEKNTDYAATKTVNSNENQENISDLSTIIEKVNRSVVGISKVKNKGNTIFLEDATSTLGLGTGFVASSNGYIITNQHVSGDRLSTCYVTLENGTTYTGNVVWADEDIDLSIIKIKVEGLDYLTLGDSDGIKVAQTVYAIGNPIGFEFQRTVTAGIISGIDRTIKLEEDDKTYYMEDLIQTDATINPGNSGGPLINAKGEVIGINSVKITTAEGIGFAIPINIIKPILEKLISTGEYSTPTLGVFAYDKNVIPYINQELGIKQELNEGIYVASVVKNSPAESVGIKEGDILLSIDNQELNKMSDLRKYIYSKQPGDKILIKYQRNGKTTEKEVELKKKRL